MGGKSRKNGVKKLLKGIYWGIAASKSSRWGIWTLPSTRFWVYSLKYFKIWSDPSYELIVSLDTPWPLKKFSKSIHSLWLWPRYTHENSWPAKEPRTLLKASLEAEEIIILDFKYIRLSWVEFWLFERTLNVNL